MKEKVIVPTWGYIFILIAMLPPLLYLHAVTAQWNPFAIKGPVFVHFYGICLGCSCAALFIPRLFHSPDVFYVPLKWLFIFTLAIGLARLCQGIYHHKPVVYLVLMLLLETGIWQLAEKIYHKKR